MSADGDQSRKCVEEFVIPKCSAKALSLKKGQILRVTAHEGKQVADLKFINAENHLEQFASWWSACLNSIGTRDGGHKKIKMLFSGPPFERIMANVIADTVGDHYFGGSCSRRVREIMPESFEEGSKTCTELFSECLKPYGIALEDLASAGTFSVFMPVRINDDLDGSFEFPPSLCKQGDYIELLAEMDLLVAATSCAQASVANDFKSKAMKYQIFEQQS
jgi:uncharacterized protein YcgI (DUF1989 family)